MLAIRIEDHFLDLDAKTSATIVMENPIFDRAGIERIYSYPFKLKPTSTNLRALEFANRIDSSATIKRNATLYLAGNVFEEGVLLINGSTPKEISVAFQSKSIDLAEGLKTVKLQDISMPVKLSDDYCPDVTLIGSTPGGGNPAVFVAVKINGEIYTGNKSNMQAFVDSINADFPGLVSLANIPGVPPDGGFPGIIVHCVEDINDITFEIAFNDELDVNTELMTAWEITDDHQRIIDELEDIVVTGQFGDSLRFPVIHAPNLYDSNNPAYNGYANYIDETGDIDLSPGGIPSTEELAWETTVIPLPRLYYVLEQIAAYFSFQVGGSLWSIEELKEQLVIWTNRPAEKLWTRLIKPVKNMGIGRIRLADSTVHIEQHLPEASVQEFLTRFINTFCAFMTYRDGKLNFQPIRPLLRGRPQDWSPYADPDYTYDIQENKGYTLDYERKAQEPELDQLQRIEGGPEAQEFFPGFYTLYDDRRTFFRIWLTPYSSEVGISPAFDNAQQTSFRLLFYRGMQEDYDSNLYPLATHGRYNHLQEEVGEYALSWDGDGGLLYWWQDYINLIVKGRTVTKLMHLPIQEILALRSWNAVVKKIYNEQGEFSGVVKSLRFKAGTRGISLAEVTFAKI